MSKSPVRVTVTGAAGQIGYQLAFRIASGQMLGPDQPVTLQLLEITPAMDALKGVAMELEDCAFDTLADIVISDNPEVAFKDSQYALLVGSRPRSKGMERKDLLEANAAIFSVQGKAINDNASRDVKVLVVGNPANTNCLIAMSNAPDVPNDRFSAMMRLDHNRAKSQLAARAGVAVRDVTRMTVWGNHSATQYPDMGHALIEGEAAAGRLGDPAWVGETFIPTVQQRGAAIINARGQSSAASAANACINHVQSWHSGTQAGDWTSMAIPSTGDYGSPEGVIFSYPVTIADGEVSVVPGLDLSDADKIISAATAAGVDARVGYSMRYLQKYSVGWDNIQQGKLGEIVGITGRVYNSRKTGLTILRRSADATPVVDIVTYLVDVACWYMAPHVPVEVVSRGHGTVFREHGFDVDDIAFSMIRFSNGTVVDAGVCYMLPENFPTSGQSIRFEVFGTDGALMIDDDHRDQMLYTEHGYSNAYTKQELNFAFLGSRTTGEWVGDTMFGRLANETRAWIDNLVTGSDSYLTTVQDARTVLAVTLAIEESLHTGQPVRIEQV